jgi:hypothetical protein
MSYACTLPLVPNPITQQLRAHTFHTYLQTVTVVEAFPTIILLFSQITQDMLPCWTTVTGIWGCCGGCRGAGAGWKRQTQLKSGFYLQSESGNFMQPNINCMT